MSASSGPASRGEPAVEILHEIPGRIRVQLSEAPSGPERMEEAVKGHEGIRAVRYSPHTRSVLVTFDPRSVSSREIVMRVALSLSIDRDSEAVRIVPARVPDELSLSALLSILLIGSAFTARVAGTQTTRTLELVAGIGTAGAVVEHAYEEVRQRGDLDPEVLAIVYLLRAFYGGNLLAASALTWFATFARHLMRPPVSGARIRRVAMSGGDGRSPHYEVVVSPLREASGLQRGLRLLPRVLRMAIAAEGPRRVDDLIGDIERLSLRHGEAIDGLGGSEKDIPLRIR